MINICDQCGEYQADKKIVTVGQALCSACGAIVHFTPLPLYLVGGPSAAGKTTLCRAALNMQLSAVLLDMDILWNEQFNTPETQYRAFFETWLRLAKNIMLNGRSAVLFGAGACVSENIEPCVEARYFSSIHYLAVVADDDTIAHRLKQRPEWRDCSRDSFISAQIEFNQSLKRSAADDPKLTLLDTTDLSEAEALQRLTSWLEEK